MESLTAEETGRAEWEGVKAMLCVILVRRQSLVHQLNANPGVVWRHPVVVTKAQNLLTLRKRGHSGWCGCAWHDQVKVFHETFLRKGGTAASACSGGSSHTCSPDMGASALLLDQEPWAWQAARQAHLENGYTRLCTCACLNTHTHSKAGLTLESQRDLNQRAL